MTTILAVAVVLGTVAILIASLLEAAASRTADRKLEAAVIDGQRSLMDLSSALDQTLQKMGAVEVERSYGGGSVNEPRAGRDVVANVQRWLLQAKELPTADVPGIAARLWEDPGPTKHVWYDKSHATVEALESRASWALWKAVDTSSSDHDDLTWLADLDTTDRRRLPSKASPKRKVPDPIHSFGSTDASCAPA